ncbi:MAG: WG repeat-containing protein, partial [Cyclobacteriaceae bacterium]
MRFFTLSILLLLNSQLLYSFAEIIYEESGKQGLKDDRGEILIPATYEEIGWSTGEDFVTGNIIGYRLNGRWGLISIENEIITPAVFAELKPGGRKQFIAKRVDKALRFVPSGIIDEEGETVIPFEYLNIIAAADSYIVQTYTSEGMRFGVISQRNRVIMPAQFPEIRYLGYSRFGIRNDFGKWALFNMQGKPLSSFNADEIENFNGNLTRAYLFGSVGLMDLNGNWVIDPDYADIKTGSGKATLTAYPEWDILTERNMKLHSVAFDSVLPWQQQYWKVIANGHEWIVDEEFNAVTPSSYEHIDWLGEQLLIFSEGRKYGIIKPSGEQVILPRYDTLFALKDRIYAHQETGANRGWNLFGMDGKRISQFAYKQMQPEQASGLIPVKRNEKWGMLDRDGREVINCTFDSVGESLTGMISVKFKG